MADDGFSAEVDPVSDLGKELKDSLILDAAKLSESTIEPDREDMKDLQISEKLATVQSNVEIGQGDGITGTRNKSPINSNNEAEDAQGNKLREEATTTGKDEKVAEQDMADNSKQAVDLAGGDASNSLLLKANLAASPETAKTPPLVTNQSPVAKIPTQLQAPPQRHPLQSEWTLWFMDGDKRKQQDHKWGSNLIEIYTIKDVEDWWLLYSYILLPSKLRVKNDYMLFREKIEPKWEDPSNKNGGKWQLVLPNKFRLDKLDGMWLTTILSMIGEHYGDLGMFVNGAYLQRRQKEDRISLWTRSADPRDKESTEMIGRILKHALHLSVKSELHYLKHEDPNINNTSKTGQPNQSWHRRNQEANRLYKV